MRTLPFALKKTALVGAAVACLVPLAACGGGGGGSSDGTPSSTGNGSASVSQNGAGANANGGAGAAGTSGGSAGAGATGTNASGGQANLYGQGSGATGPNNTQQQSGTGMLLSSDGVRHLECAADGQVAGDDHEDETLESFQAWLTLSEGGRVRGCRNVVEYANLEGPDSLGALLPELAPSALPRDSALYQRLRHDCQNADVYGADWGRCMAGTYAGEATRYFKGGRTEEGSCSITITADGHFSARYNNQPYKEVGVRYRYAQVTYDDRGDLRDMELSGLSAVYLPSNGDGDIRMENWSRFSLSHADPTHLYVSLMDEIGTDTNGMNCRVKL